MPWLPNQFIQAYNFSPCTDLRSADSSNIYVPKPNTELYRSTFVYSGAKIWNDLPVSVKTAQSIDDFKRNTSYVPDHLTKQLLLVIEVE